jgi:enoyl-CoA hydratase/carnithine racemase
MDHTGVQAATTPVLTIEGARATIRLNRPAHLNRIEPDDILALDEMLDRIGADRDIRVMVLTGTGRRSAPAITSATSRPGNPHRPGRRRSTASGRSSA